MKKILISLVMVLMITGLSGLAKADDISFIWWPTDGETLQGVDGDTSSWSNADWPTKDLGVSQWNLLGGTAWVNGYRGDGTGSLTHRGTRGLGIWGGVSGIDDEIDGVNLLERIEISFNQAQYLNSLQVRSLFVEPELWNPGVEQGVVDFYLNGDNFFTQHMMGTDDFSAPGTKGIVSFAYPTPKIIDKLVFYVPQGETYSSGSDFAVAKLNVNATPEPLSSLLFVIGGISLAAFGRKKLRRRS